MNTYTIGQMAAKYDLTLRALRFYEEKGLIAPARDGTTRIYHDSDQAALDRLLPFLRAGVSLHDCRRMERMVRDQKWSELETFKVSLLKDRAVDLGQRSIAVSRLRMFLNKAPS